MLRSSRRRSTTPRGPGRAAQAAPFQGVQASSTLAARSINISQGGHHGTANSHARRIPRRRVLQGWTPLRLLRAVGRGCPPHPRAPALGRWRLLPCERGVRLRGAPPGLRDDDHLGGPGARGLRHPQARHSVAPLRRPDLRQVGQPGHGERHQVEGGALLRRQRAEDPGLRRRARRLQRPDQVSAHAPRPVVGGHARTIGGSPAWMPSSGNASS